RAAKLTPDPILDRLFERQQQELENVTGPVSPLRPAVGREGNVDGHQFQDGQWVLTFDDGPNRRYSPLIMEALLSHHDKVNPNGAPGTFFWLAENLGGN